MTDIKDEPSDEPKEDIVIVKMGLNVGDKFGSFREWQQTLDKVSKANYLRFWKRDSRTIETARKKVKRSLKSELEFYQLRYSCFFAQKPRTRPTLGKRKRRSLAAHMESPCPAVINIRVTEDGEYLEIYHMIEQHNHPVNAHEYQKLIPKKKALESLLGDDDGNGYDDTIDDDERFKLVLKKCKQITRIASVSSPAKVAEIIKNLDDYIFYLKYTTPKEEMEIEGMKQQKINNNIEEVDKSVAADESIKIIFEPDPNADN